jgi:Uma2 family endonuclease
MRQQGPSGHSPEILVERITGDIYTRLTIQLRGTGCETYSNDMRVKTTPTRYTYPDVVVVCDKPQFEDDEVDTLLNPTVIVEVLSASTKARDRGEKFFEYRALPSVKDYLVVSQDTMHVEHYTRQSEDEWMLHDVTEPEVTIRIPSIACELSLAEIYERVQFPQS